MAFAYVKRDLSKRKAAANEAAARRRENYMATTGRNIRRRPIVDKKGRGFRGDLAQLNRDASQLPVLKELIQMRDDTTGAAKKGLEYIFEQMPSIPKYVRMAVDAFGRNAEEVGAASRDYGIPVLKGGNPIALDRGSYADQFLEPLMDDKRAYNQAVRDDKVFYTGLEEMSGDNYEASHPGLIALLNDPSRLNKLQKDSPIRALNYMRSIMGDPSNIGFDQLEAMRAGNFEGLNLPGTADKGDYGGLTATQIAQKLLPQYRQAANEMYGEGFLGNTASATYGDTPEPIGLYPGKYGVVRNTAENNGIIPKIRPKPEPPVDSSVSMTDLPSTISAINYQEPDLVNDDILPGEPGFSTPEPFNAANMYPNLTFSEFRNQFFPGMALENITQEDIDNAIAMENTGFMSSPQLNQLYR